jgi:putative methyltransferase (TIGR04325 family)
LRKKESKNTGNDSFFKKSARLLLPPIVLKLRNSFKNARQEKEISDAPSEVYGWSGNFGSWEDAKKQCSGYDSDIIIEKVKNSLLKVKNGEAVHERDSVLFNEITYSFPLLAALMWVAARKDGKLNVLDFGGSLGSTYFQNRLFLKDLSEVNWNIVEQEKFIIEGKKNFESSKLRFYRSVEDCLEENKPDVVLLSGVLQYLEKPYEFLRNLEQFDFEYIFIARTAFFDEFDDILTIQKVPPAIYDASYPAWFFSEEKFLNYIKERKYEIMLEFDDSMGLSIVLENRIKVFWSGYILKNRNGEV